MMQCSGMNTDGRLSVSRPITQFETINILSWPVFEGYKIVVRVGFNNQGVSIICCTNYRETVIPTSLQLSSNFFGVTSSPLPFTTFVRPFDFSFVSHIRTVKRGLTDCEYAIHFEPSFRTGSLCNLLC